MLKADFGMHMQSCGLAEGGSIEMSFVIGELGTSGKELFSVSATSERFCATIDMDRDGLDQLVLACPGDLASMVLQATREANQPGPLIEFPDPLKISVSGTLGAVHRNMREEFRPIVVQEITGPDGLVPVSAGLILVDLGAMMSALDEAGLCDPNEPRWQAARQRVRRLGERLNEFGGIECMRGVYTPAVQLLTDKDIHIGRMIESVWSGIGDWYG